ncbi:LysM peptidoglycan-binding domain-containing protein [Clostridium sp. DL1XJH146]
MKFLKKPLFLITTIVVIAGSLILIITLTNTNNKVHSNEAVQVENTSQNEIENTPSSSDLTKEENIKETTVEDEYYNYTVKEGDSLYSISTQQISWTSYSNALKMITEMNNLIETDSLHIGEVLIIPINDIDTSNCTSYTIKEGDTLYGIASDFYSNIEPEYSVQSLMDKNNIYDPKELTAGRQIFLPDASEVASSNTSDTACTANSTTNNVTDTID